MNFMNRGHTSGSGPKSISMLDCFCLIVLLGLPMMVLGTIGIHSMEPRPPDAEKRFG